MAEQDLEDGDEVGRAAARRKETADARARELRERQLRLRSGAPSSAEDVARARAAAEKAAERAAGAARSAAHRHREAAALHDVVADTEERAAQADPARAGEHEELAARHRAAARVDREEATQAEPGR